MTSRIKDYAELGPQLSFSDWRQEVLSRLQEQEAEDVLLAEPALTELRRAS